MPAGAVMEEEGNSTTEDHQGETSGETSEEGLIEALEDQEAAFQVKETLRDGEIVLIKHFK